MGIQSIRIPHQGFPLGKPFCHSVEMNAHASKVFHRQLVNAKRNQNLGSRYYLSK